MLHEGQSPTLCVLILLARNCVYLNVAEMKLMWLIGSQPQDAPIPGTSS